MPVSLVLWSLAAALIFLSITSLLSRPGKIRDARRRVHGLLLEMWLYGDEPAQVFRTQLALVGANVRYLSLLLPAILACMLPLLLIWLHLDRTLSYRPLRAGETAIVTAHLIDPARIRAAAPGIAIPTGFLLETPPLRVVAEGKVIWRVRAASDASSELRLGGPEFSAVEVAHPQRSIPLFGIGWPWQAWFVLLFAVAVLTLRKRFGVVF